MDDQKEQELVSIIMPTFKNDINLKRAIESVINQDYNNVELIIIDDNANECWNKKVRKYISNYKDKIKIILITNDENMGSAKSRNLGINYSTGKYITFLDDDDEYLPNKVGKQVEYIIKQNGDFCITDLFLLNDNEKIVRKRVHKYLLKNNNLLAIHLKYHLTGTDTLMFKKDYLLKIGKFDEIDLGDEFYLILKAILNKGKLVYLPGNYVKAYVHEAGIGITAGKNKMQGEEVLFNRKKEYFSCLKKADIKYIKMRHNLVIASCYLRIKKYDQFLLFLFKACINSPLDFIKQILKRKNY